MATAALLTYRSTQELYFTVDELVDGRGAALYAAAATGGADHRGRVQVRGTVNYETVERPSEGLEMRFVLEGRDAALPVVYHGVVPDTFEIAETVTVAGYLETGGGFAADQLFVQCPSKYEAVPPGGSAAAGG
jgi:cytochrome c-type biogenesis protein CcmE